MKHGQEPKVLYKCWLNMRQRCINTNNTDYFMYGARGISICQEWINSFESFRDWALANGWKNRLEIDRIDNDGNYCPENCRWVTRKTNSRNTRRGRYYTIKDEARCLSEWCEIYGASFETVKSRVYSLGWSIEDALTIPKGERRK